MQTTFHATCFTHETTKWYPPDSFERLVSSFVDAQDDIDLRRKERITEIVRKLQQKITAQQLFAVRWTVA